MVRLPRLDLLGVPQRIVQRGNNQLPCFLDDGGGLRYLTLLRDALLSTGVHLPAYMLMDNHVHLLATPPAAGAIGRMMRKGILQGGADAIGLSCTNRSKSIATMGTPSSHLAKLS
jgi:hypothetical protein